MRKAVRELLMFESEIEIVGEASSFGEMIDMRQQLQPDIVVMDLHMADESKLASEQLKDFGSRVLTISSCSADDGIPKAKQIGAATFLDKMKLYQDLVPAIRELALGEGV
jgi:two-component system, NarL family, nitrate/nitrite response regulator NarL